MHVLIEHAQGDVRQQRGQDAPLRRSGKTILLVAKFGQDPGLEERFHQREHTLVLDSGPHPIHQGGMRDRVKARLDVRVQHPPVALGAEPLNLGDRVVRPPHRPEPVGDRFENGLEDRFQHQLQRRLNNPVRHRGNPQATDLPAPTRLRDPAFPHRQRPEHTLLELGA